ncbi:hypothetical protein F511_42223 [Dorcoceras hygrometricum]|uniref:Uncharacterized protein n=1 Tax=Dorcoceras hygrometricum TaxID=472368 RepID=A0A2Z7DAB2_9LAMI|nr:hypothetical protein F511_42223 [Dorcoceras hygrometricum]
MTVLPLNSGKPRIGVTLNGSGIQLAVGPQPLRLRNHNSGLTHRIMVKRLETSPHDPLGITDSACKNQLVVVSVQYGPFNPYIPIRSTTIDSIGYPRMSASGESSTTMHRLLHASGSHPIPTPYDPKCDVVIFNIKRKPDEGKMVPAERIYDSVLTYDYEPRYDVV